MKTLINKCLDPQDHFHMEEIMNSKMVGDNKLRRIYKVK